MTDISIGSLDSPSKKKVRLAQAQNYNFTACLSVCKPTQDTNSVAGKTNASSNGGEDDTTSVGSFSVFAPSYRPRTESNVSNDEEQITAEPRLT